MSTVELPRQNRNHVFRSLIDAEEPLTKQDLAAGLFMSLPTLTQNLKELDAMGLIDSSCTTDSTGGRKPRLISIIPGARFAIGELSSGSIRMVALDLKCSQLAFQQFARPFENTDTSAKELAARLEQFLDDNSLSRDRLLGVGITVPGIVNADQTIIEYAPTARIQKMSPAMVNRYIPYPTFLDNDATCGGFAEWWNHTEMENLAYLSLSRGIGGAILVNGSAYDGDHHRSAGSATCVFIPADGSATVADGGAWRHTARPPAFRMTCTSRWRIFSPVLPPAMPPIRTLGRRIWTIWLSPSAISTPCWTAMWSLAAHFLNIFPTIWMGWRRASAA